jgi:mercuric ion binding protein
MFRYFILAAALVSASTVQADTIEMKVNGLVCAFCARGIEKTLRKNPATEDVYVSLEDKLVAVALHEGRDISDAELTKDIADAGYTVTDIQRTSTPIEDIRARPERDSE